MCWRVGGAWSYDRSVTTGVRVELDVTAAGIAGVDRLVADLFVPDGAKQTPLVVCLPGGGMGRRYFDLRGDLPGQWSMARHLVDAHGLSVAVLDHPGVGESSIPDDPYGLTPTVVAAVDAMAVTAIRDVVNRDLEVTRLIGLGHSMGGLVVAHQQWRRHTYDAVVLLGFGGAGLPDFLTEQEMSLAGTYERMEPELAALVRKRFGAALVPGSTTSSDFLNPGVTTPGARELLGRASCSLLALCGLTSMIPGSSDDALASVDVPVLLGVGEFDIAGDVADVAMTLSASPQVTTFVVLGAGHNHSISDNRLLLWDAIGAWVGDLVP
jgi:pimeloyl-ACP methyl ester carboxylesterase